MDNFTPTPPAPIPTPTKPRSPLWPILIIVIIVLVLTGAGAGYAYYVNPEIIDKLPEPIRAWLLKTPDSTEIQSKMLAALTEVKAATYEIELTSPPQWSDQQNVGGNLEISGSFDALTPGNFKSQNQLRLQAALSPGEDTIDVGLESLIIGKDLYLKISQPDLPEALVDFDLSWLVNRWIKAEGKELKEQAGQFSKAADLQNFEPVKEIFKKNNPLSLGQFIGKENIDGQPTYHYLVVFDEQKVASLFEDLEKFAQSTGGGPRAETEIDRLRYQMAHFREVFSSFEQTPTEIWIDQADYLPLKLKTRIKSAQQPNEIDLTAHITNYNQPLSLTPPPETTSLEEIMKQFFEKILGPLMFGQMTNGQSNNTPFSPTRTRN